MLDDTGVLLKTISFAAIKHAPQKRKDPEGTPYINHPIGVALILWEAGVHDLPVLQAAVLHDTIEDTGTTLEELVREFGTVVANIVQECTDDKSLPWMERKRLQIETVTHKSTQARLVKMADKIYNLRDLQRATPIGWTQERVEKYFIWAREVTNGCRGLNTILETTLDDIYNNGKFLFEGQYYPCIPKS